MSQTNAEHERADALRNRAALLDAAVGVLASDPTASLAEVAARAGVGRATLYRHFPNRGELGAAIREQALEQAAAALQAADLEQLPVREGIRNAVEVLVPLGTRFRYLLAQGADADESFALARDRALRPLTDLVRRGIVSGELRAPSDPAWMVAVLTALLTATARAAQGSAISPREAADRFCEAFFHGFALR
jgi:TetR/AcrR family transcriptional regulator, mexCD-oprJ operon repressor